MDATQNNKPEETKVQETNQVSDSIAKAKVRPKTPWLNVRATPNETGEILECIQSGDEVETGKKVKDWTKVKTEKGTVGYCMSIYLVKV